MIHSALSHTAQDVILRCRTQRWISSRVVAHRAGCHSALFATTRNEDSVSL